VDLVADYKLNGFGRRLYSDKSDDGVTTFERNSAYSSLIEGGHASWDVGIEVSVPLFLRAERAQLRQIEFRLMKAQSALAEQEQEVAHELTFAFQSAQRLMSNLENNRMKRRATRRRLDATKAEYENDLASSLDLLLRAQSSQAQADIAYHRNLAEYNKALWDIQFRSGTILQRHNIQVRTDGATAPLDTLAPLGTSGPKPKKPDAFPTDNLGLDPISASGD
ncbi:MAG: TolC family protein, partial [Planctomycetes bacterium]|nr:TolC family protein [Planctomycetota bacterium]